MSSQSEPVKTRSIDNSQDQRWRECLQRIGAQESEALAVLYRETVPFLYGMAVRILRDEADAEEVILDVFQCVWKGSQKYDAQRGSVWRWLALLTRSRSLDRLRARKPDSKTLPIAPSTQAATPPPDADVQLQERQRRVRAALGALPPEQRRVIELAYFSDLSHSELSVALGVPLGTIKTRIKLAMRKLRESLHGVEGDTRHE